MKILITGGAGFIGCNAARHFMQRGHEVVVFDNLSRKGASANLEWLRSQGRFAFIAGDVRDSRQVMDAVGGCDVVLHLAAQVAVTRSIVDPRVDFETNALGTLNVLEAARLATHPPIVLFSSTNKVYGDMANTPIVEESDHYRLADLPFGVSEEYPLNFLSPYGCSKGAADQYTRDYARIYGLRTVVLRQSCIYGTRQLGVEDQGWVAWFLAATLLDRPITLYGDGKQVRDLLFVDDLVELYERVIERIDCVSGEVFNVGGGPANQLSLLQCLEQIRKVTGKEPAISFAPWRPGDQRVFVADVRRASDMVGWQPKTDVAAGIDALYEWARQNRDLLASVLSEPSPGRPAASEGIEE